ncbi:MFS general substrate transporter [Thozetella sp. PMI_491]|nr:MFS general substrate transporter [Thozetella sp. PMI_491]
MASEPTKDQKDIVAVAAPDSASVEDGKLEKYAKQIDEAAQYLHDHAGEYASYSLEEAKKLKIIISNAALYGMTADLHLVGSQYNWVGSIFYFGFLLGEWPFSPIMQRLPIGKLLSATVVAWGVLVLLMGATQNAAGMMTLRFIMGFFEAPLYPMMSVITVMWYKKSEQPIRVTVWFTSLSSVVTGLVSWGIGHAVTGIASWRLLFITLGAFTFVWGIILFFFLPDSPLSGTFLSDREKYIAVDRMKENMTGVHNKQFKWYQVREAFLDWKSWLIVAISIFLNVPNGGLVTFAAQIVSGMGFGALETTLLGMPTGVIQTVSAFMVSGLSRVTTNKRALWCSLCCLVPMTCSIIIRKLPSDNKTGLLLAYYFFYFFWGAYPTIISLPLANTSGHTKKLTVNAMVFSSYCIANIVAPQLFQSSEAPHYTTGYNAILGCEIGAIACMGLYATGCYFENKRRDRIEGTTAQLTTDDMLDDATDKEKVGFRYSY